MVSWVLGIPLQAFPMARTSAIKALELDEFLASAHSSLAFIHLAHDWDWVSAGKESRRAIELGPHLADGHFVYSLWCLTSGLFQEAIAEAKTALDLDPLSLPVSYNLALIYYLTRRYDDAIQHLHKIIELDSSFTAAHQTLALSYARKGRFREALAAADESNALARGDLRSRGILGAVKVMAGNQEDARKILTELEEGSGAPNFSWASQCAIIRALLGEPDQAFEWLDKACQGRVNTLIFLTLNRNFENLHSDPRFDELVQRIGLPHQSVY
jgi:tetratricopeptide (TPR) repeat protein